MPTLKTPPLCIPKEAVHPKVFFLDYSGFGSVFKSSPSFGIYVEPSIRHCMREAFMHHLERSQ